MTYIISGLTAFAGALKGYSVANNQSKLPAEQKQHNPYLLPIYYLFSTPFTRGTLEHNVSVWAHKGVEMYKTIHKNARPGHYLLAACVSQGLLIGAGYHVGKLTHETLQ
jgi:hypothetical protein